MFTFKVTQADKNTLLPGAATVYEAVPSTPAGIIDVISDLTFTASPITPYLKNKIPFILLTEYDVAFNSTLASALYYTKFLVQGATVAGTTTSVRDKVNSIKTFVEKMITAAKPDDITKTLSNKVGLGGTVTDATAMIKDLIAASGDEFSDATLTPYNGLYLRKATGFKYIMPFYDDKKRNVSINYSSNNDSLAGKSKLTDLVTAGTELANTGLGTILFGSPGAYIEAPQFYNMPDGETVNIAFDLINTINPNDYIKHHQFLFLLVFQNTHYRKDLARVIPPKMYRCDIPGDQVFPYCYISRLDINFKGSRRIINVPNPAGGTRPTVIPDAYSVSLTIKSLNPSSGNFMVAGQNITVR